MDYWKKGLMKQPIIPSFHYSHQLADMKHNFVIVVPIVITEPYTPGFLPVGYNRCFENSSPIGS